MAISDTIQSMYENVGNVYDVLELAGADLTNVDKNIQNLKQSWEERLLYFLANGTDVVWNNWLPKVTGTGESITLNNTIEAKMDFVYKGNTSQYSTTGKNLFNINTAHSNNLSDAGITATFNSDGTITVNGTKNANYKTISYFITLPAGTYYFSGCPSGGSGGGYSIIVQTTNEISSQIFDTGNGATFTLTEQKKISFFPVRVGADAVTFNNAVFKPMIARVPVTYNDYEPYTGNQPSPNPDYPQDIQVVSGDNTIKVEGANLVSSYRNATGTGQFWAALYVKANLKPNAFYEVSFIDNSTGNGYTRNESLAASVSSYSIISNGERQYYSFKTKDNISPDGNGEYLIFKNNKAQSQGPQFTNVDIREVAQLTTESFDYEPYQSQTYPINIGNIELCKIGDYQDKIYKDNGKWYLNKQIGKVVLDGSENWSAFASVNYEYQLSLFAGLSTDTSNQYFPALCNKYINHNVAGSSLSNYEFSHFSTQPSTVKERFVRFRNNDITTLANWKTELQTNNAILYVPLATPTTTEITDTTLISQLEAIKKSYNTQTNISQENNDLPFELDVVALGELS